MLCIMLCVYVCFSPWQNQKCSGKRSAAYVSEIPAILLAVSAKSGNAERASVFVLSVHVCILTLFAGSVSK